MKSIKITGIISLLAFMAAAVIYITNSGGYVNIGSKIIWAVDKGYYSDLGIYFIENDYVVSPSPETTTDYEFEQMCQFKKKLDDAGINLLYVNKPTKYLDDSIFDRFGVESYCNRNADKLLARLDEAGINTLDLRAEIRKDGLDIYKMFYRTDHHWTVPAGKWGAGKIAAALNEYCGYDIDLSIYDDENYDFKTTENAWYGEQGEKFVGAGAEMDDYTLVTPKFETSYTVDGQQGDFISSFIKDTRQAFHYNYSSRNCINNNVKKGKVLILGDSFDVITEPFLSLSVHETNIILRRDFDDIDVYDDIVRDGGYDTVIICYAPFMIGAHDSETNVNRKMFSLVK